MTPRDKVVHSALEPAPAAEALPISKARLTDRARLAILLQGAALLAHLEAAGWCLADGWGGAAVDATGLLRGVTTTAGPDQLTARRRLVDLATRLFGGDPAIRGRGEARGVVRRLAAEWRDEAISRRADRHVARLLDVATPLWRAEFGPARSTLAAVLVAGRRERLRVAGPSWLRREVLARVGSRRALERFLSSDRLRAVWQCPPRPRSDDARLRVAVHRGLNPAAGEAERLGLGRALYRLGRFERALDVVGGCESEAAAILAAHCLLWLERPASAWRKIERLPAGGGPERRLARARVALAAQARLGDHRTAARRAAAELRSVPGWLRPEARLVAAEAAARRGDVAGLRLHLRRSRIVLERPALAWRWYRTAGHGALIQKRGATAAAFYGRALAMRRRQLAAFEAALLWDGVARGRRMAGKLAAAERAATHAVRLHGRGGRPRRTRRSIARLADLQLRRGRTHGLAALIRRAGWLDPAHDPDLDPVALAARCDLVRGLPERALERLLVGDGARPEGERAVLAARALGWIGRARRARLVLGAAGPHATAWLEAEERPALWALAGDRRRARTEATGPAAALWLAFLAGEKAGAREWAGVDRLESFRVARLVHDLELLAPGFCPAARIAFAARRLRRAGADAWAARLEAAERSAWQALAEFLEHGRSDKAALGQLLTAFGAPEARLSFERAGERTVVVAGGGGTEELVVERDGGRLVLATPLASPRLSALLRLVADRWPLPSADQPAHRHGIVGESPVLKAVLERSGVLAASALPVLILGETGTGKELLARRVHALSRGAAGPFLPVNCAAVARDLLLSDLFGHRRGSFTGADRDRAGVFETARGGTVFLDEIGDLPEAAQGALLRVLQEGEVRRIGESAPRRVDARVVAATHRDLAELVRRGRFRQDLYFRLEAASVELPPLRRRRGDVPLLIDHFLRRLRPDARATLSRQARAKLEVHEWPGNVRELENALAVALAVSQGGPIETQHLELGTRGESATHGYHARVASYRRRLIEEALAACGGNRAAAARRIGLSRQAMTYLVRSLEIRVSPDGLAASGLSGQGR